MAHRTAINNCMQTSLMTTTFPCLKPRQSCRLPPAATATPALSASPHSWRRWRRHTVSRCLRAAQQQHSSAQARCGHLDDDIVVVDVGDRRSPAGGFRPSLWGDFFLHHSNPMCSDEQQTWMAKRAQVLKEEVRDIVSRSVTRSLHQRLLLVDALERLCLDYLFEEEINVTLAEVSTADVSGCDLQTVALWFYLLRKHGYRASSNVFVRFEDEDGVFLVHSPADQLTLYNAASLRTHGETVLDEAASFARKRLEATLPYMEGSLAREIESALEIPLPRRVSVYDLKDHISRYENEATVDQAAIIQLAKLNSNIMQLHYQRELKITTRWWKDLHLELKLPFARDRIVECYWWMLGVYFEPCYSRGRIISTMVISIVTLFDDIYDSYGTAEDCELFTKCMESWDLNAANNLPECMKFALKKIFDSYQTIENELSNVERYRMFYLRNFTLGLVRSFNAEVKMREVGYVPKSVEEHLQVSSRTGGCPILSCASLVGMGDIATKESFDWVSSMPKMVQGLSIILRLLDDLQTYERERMTPHVASTIDSYMKEHNVSIEAAREKIHELKEETWKDFNAEWLNPKRSQPKEILDRIFNLTRTMEFFYNRDDNFTNCHNIKDAIHSLLVEPFTIV